MYQKNFVCLCKWTVSPIYTIFDAAHAVANMINIFKFQGIWRIFMRVRACTDGQTGSQTECINTFQLCWKDLCKYLRPFTTFVHIFFLISEIYIFVSRHHKRIVQLSFWMTHELFWIISLLKIYIPQEDTCTQIAKHFYVCIRIWKSCYIIITILNTIFNFQNVCFKIIFILHTYTQFC